MLLLFRLEVEILIMYIIQQIQLKYFFVGLMFDSTGNYTVPFFVMGLILTLGSVLYFFVLCTNEYKDMRERQREAKLQLDSTSDKKRKLSDERKSSVDV